MQLLVQIPVLLQKGIRYQPSLGFSHPALRECVAQKGHRRLPWCPSMRLWTGRWLRATGIAFPHPAGAACLRFCCQLVCRAGIHGAAYRLVGGSSPGSTRRLRSKRLRTRLVCYCFTSDSGVTALATDHPVLYERGQFIMNDVTLTSQALMAFTVGHWRMGASQGWCDCLMRSKTPAHRV